MNRSPATSCGRGPCGYGVKRGMGKRSRVYTRGRGGDSAWPDTRISLSGRLPVMPPGLIHHSCRGSRYCNPGHQKLLEGLGIKPSMGRKGNCYDNALMESFRGTIKYGLVHHGRYRTRAEAITGITGQIEIFCNRERWQKRPGYCIARLRTKKSTTCKGQYESQGVRY